MSRRRAITVAGLFSLLVVPTVPVAHAETQTTGAGTQPPGPVLSWEPCGTTREAARARVECDRVPLPLDYDDPLGATVDIAVARVPAADPARRIGSLFINFGGPGGPAVEYAQELGAGVFESLNRYYDIIAFDPRGVGQSTAVDCRFPEDFPLPAPPASPEDIDVPGLLAFGQAYADACVAANGALLEHLSTANVARDMDALRAALGEERLSFMGFSYGTLVGATYVSLFPDRYRTVVLDGAIDPQLFLNDPLADISTYVAGFEDALDRFLAACTADQVACAGFGGRDPVAAYDALLARADATPIPAPGVPEDPTPVTGEEIRGATVSLLYAKQAWGLLAQALAGAERGDASLFRELLTVPADAGGLSADAYNAITGTEQAWPTDVQPYLERAAAEYAAFPHFWTIGAAVSIPYVVTPARDEDAFYGPFTANPFGPPVLVVGTTHDPATPYPAAIALTAQLGNARLVTMDGDGHTAYGGNSACIDSATDSYLVAGVLPTAGTVCPQEVPFTAPERIPADAAAAAAAVLWPIAGLAEVRVR